MAFAVGVVGRLLPVAFYADDDSFLDQVAVPERSGVVAEVLGGLVDDARWAIATAPGGTERTWFVAAPLTVEVAELDREAGSAVVEVWVVTVFSRQGLAAPESRFVMVTAGLRWAGGRWWLWDLAVEPGPAADLALGETPATPEELDRALVGHQLVPSGVGT